MKINKARPVEELIGPNRQIVVQKLGRIHCCTSVRDSAREARPKNMRSYPVKLRRGWALCVLETVKANRDCFYGVTSGRFNSDINIKWNS